MTAVSKREQPRVRSLITVGGWPRVSTYGGQRDPIPQNSGVRERVKVDAREDVSLSSGLVIPPDW